MHVKWVGRMHTIEMVARVLEKGVRMVLAGRPGPVYIHFPANLAKQPVENPKIPAEFSPSLPPTPHYQQILQIMSLLQQV